MTPIIEVAEREDLDYLPGHPQVRVLSCIGTGNGHGPSILAELVREHELPNGSGYCWFAGEAGESRAVRKHLRGLGWTIDQFDIVGYWRYDSETWDAKFAEVQDEVVAVYVRAMADGKGDKVAFEEFDEAWNELASRHRDRSITHSVTAGTAIPRRAVASSDSSWRPCCFSRHAWPAWRSAPRTSPC